MKPEIYVLAQSIERIGLELQRCRAALSDLLAESVASTSERPPMPPDVVPQSCGRRQHLYASGELAQRVLAMVGAVDEMSVADVLRTLQRDKPGTQMSSLRPCLSNLVADGRLWHVDGQKGVYCVPERKPHLSVLA